MTRSPGVHIAWLIAALPIAACGGAAGSPADGGGAADAHVADAARPDAALPPGPCEAFGQSSDTPLAIPDLGSVDSVIVLPAVAADVVKTVVVQVDLAHAYPRDLDLSLRSPAGHEVVLAQDASAGYDGARFEPSSQLAGEPASGAWTLRVVDDSAGDVGTLLGWSIRIDACPPPECVTTTIHREQEATGQPLGAYIVDAPDLTIARVRSSLTLTYVYDGELELRLYAPGGQDVLLSSGNGGSGDDYLGTVFDDTAEQSIVDGVPPFTGSFRPEEPLARLTGGPAGGSWLLVVSNRGPAFPDFDEPPPNLVGSYLEVDACELECPVGTRAFRYGAAGPFLPIDPGATVESQVAVGGEGPVSRAGVSLWAAGDLTLTLRSPAGTTVRLATVAGELESVVFADDAQRTLAEAASPFAGRFQPLEALAAVEGEAGEGAWTLEVANGAAGGPGGLGGWALDLCSTD